MCCEKKRNAENRLLRKPTKRGLAHSEALFKRLEDKCRLNSLPGELKEENYLRIDSTDLLPEEAARVIKERFSL